jgi:NADP-dependent 3-hydroxy acid dehydrogenase YdfG
VLLDHADTCVVLACRSRTRGEEAAAALAADNPSFRGRTSILEMDTSSDASVAAAAEAYLREHGGDQRRAALYAICNNAGIARGTAAEVLDVNVRGPKRVCDAFLPFLVGGSDDGSGRVVNISSTAAPICLSWSSPARRSFFTSPHVSWADIDGVMAEVEAMPRGTKDFKVSAVDAAVCKNTCRANRVGRWHRRRRRAGKRYTCSGSIQQARSRRLQAHYRRRGGASARAR